MNPSMNTATTEQLRASTPPPPTSVQSPETPARSKTALSSTFRTDPKLQNKRNELVSGLPKMIGEMSVGEYFEHVLPPLPSGLEHRVGEVCHILNENGTYNTSAHRWTQFPQDPGAQSSHETQVFLPLANIFDAIVQAAQRLEPDLEPNFRLVVEGNATPFSEPGGDSRPDGFLKIRDKAVSQMAKNCEVLMKKEGWQDVPKPLEASHGTTNETRESPQPPTNTGQNPKRLPPPPIYGIALPRNSRR
ncbi:hypothetical protein DFJ43DRAFT_276921 [Lentinula guzmanii]|uniref:Uncharacterized protein n=1 Tax=Lentinula guzmanii TaxID=2804957 RepID=A0AA38JUF1_9AGAR|nr:hypothetical protein DFJ43DRAFT_276921 [Lentinula guzmanii]